MGKTYLVEKQIIITVDGDYPNEEVLEHLFEGVSIGGMEWHYAPDPEVYDCYKTQSLENEDGETIWRIEDEYGDMEYWDEVGGEVDIEEAEEHYNLPKATLHEEDIKAALKDRMEGGSRPLSDIVLERLEKEAGTCAKTVQEHRAARQGRKKVPHGGN